MVSKILDSYEEIKITEEKEGIVFFELKGKEYGCWYPETDQDVSSPFILVSVSCTIQKIPKIKCI